MLDASSWFLFHQHSPYRETPIPKQIYQNSFKTLHIRVFPCPACMRCRYTLLKYRRVHRDVCPNGRSAWVSALTHLQRMRKFTQLLFSQKGHINRKTYLLYHICGLGGYLLVAYAFMAFLSLERETLHPELQYLLYVVQVLLGFLGVLLLYGTIPTSVKRLHDLNQSGWWLLLIGIILCQIQTKKGRLRAML